MNKNICGAPALQLFHGLLREFVFMSVNTEMRDLREGAHSRCSGNVCVCVCVCLCVALGWGKAGQDFHMGQTLDSNLLS